MTIDDIYGKLGNSIHKVIDDDYVEAQLFIESYRGNYANFGGQYFLKNNEKKWIDVRELAKESLSPVVFKLQEIMGESNKWNKAVFKLWPTGKFDMQFEWDEELDQKRRKFQDKS